VIARSLAALGAEVRVADPHLEGDTLAYPLVEATADELAGADAVLLVTDHDAFDYDLVHQHARYVLDTRNRLDGPSIERL
jgi:UDP-N-acetyl-D-mannosaminuronate dehydrogenase